MGAPHQAPNRASYGTDHWRLSARDINHFATCIVCGRSSQDGRYEIVDVEYVAPLSSCAQWERTLGLEGLYQGGDHEVGRLTGPVDQGWPQGHGFEGQCRLERLEQMRSGYLAG